MISLSNAESQQNGLTVFLEYLIEKAFDKSDATDKDQFAWRFIVENIRYIRQLSVKDALSTNCLLVVHAAAVYQLKLADNWESRYQWLHQFVTGFSFYKQPSAESSEAKIILLWSLATSVSFEIYQFSRNPMLLYQILR